MPRALSLFALLNLRLKLNLLAHYPVPKNHGFHLFSRSYLSPPARLSLSLFFANLMTEGWGQNSPRYSLQHSLRYFLQHGPLTRLSALLL